MQLNLTNITYTYEGAATPVFECVSATFPSGWTGVIGDNGCGKSTLALIATGRFVPDAGSVFPRLFAVYCPQDTSRAPDNLDEFAVDWGREALQLRNLLEIDEAWMWDYGHLSGGQKKRVQIACALCRRPEVLVLDEPTNDLDAPTRELLLRGLKSYKGIGVLISHDRTLLDALVDQCVVFEAGRIVTRPGGYSKVAELARNERDAQAKKHENARREERRLVAEAQRRNEEAARSNARLSARHVDKHDSDTRGRLGLAKVTSKDAIAGRAASAMASRADRASKATLESRTLKRYEASIVLPGHAAQSKSVLHISARDVRNGALTLHVPELWIEPCDHVGLSGKNGVGKTTLLRHMLALVPEQIEYAFIPQEVDGSMRHAALERLRALDNADRGRVLSLVAGLNTDPDALCEGSNISPGELKKLLIAEQLLRDPCLLILDEPTNHLDVGSIEALERALVAFPGAIVLVTHDTQLLQAVSTIRWQIDREGDEAILRVQ